MAVHARRAEVGLQGAGYYSSHLKLVKHELAKIIRKYVAVLRKSASATEDASQQRASPQLNGDVLQMVRAKIN
jgi:hypothetical protein